MEKALDLSDPPQIGRFVAPERCPISQIGHPPGGVAQVRLFLPGREAHTLAHMTPCR